VNAVLWHRLRAAVEDELPDAIELRHRLHADPRPSGQEGDTARAVVAALGAGPGIEVAGTGRLVRLGSGTDPPGGADCVALRAELDALPVAEASGVPWSARGAIMHACGHDVHLAAVVAAARAIARSNSSRPVCALLQPREEAAPSGARDIVASGVLEAVGVRAVIAAHVQPRVPPGTLAVGAGLVNASVDEFEITVLGQVGHAGYPHTVADPVLALAAAVVNLQQIPARRVDPVAGAVCMVTEIHAGSSANVVPGEARARGTLRVMRENDRSAMAAEAAAIVDHTAAAYGCKAEVRVVEGEPALRNDAVLAAATRDVLVGGGHPVTADFRSFGADDFAYYGRRVPSLMIFVGVDGPGLHDPTFVPVDDVIRTVAHALLAGYVAACDTASSVPSGLTDASRE
jgi:amidohydrolase